MPSKSMQLRPGQTGICGPAEASGQNHQHQAHRHQQGAPLSQDLPPEGEGGDRVRRTHSHSPSPPSPRNCGPSQIPKELSGRLPNPIFFPGRERSRRSAQTSSASSKSKHQHQVKREVSTRADLSPEGLLQDRRLRTIFYYWVYGVGVLVPGSRALWCRGVWGRSASRVQPRGPGGWTLKVWRLCCQRGPRRPDACSRAGHSNVGHTTWGRSGYA